MVHKDCERTRLFSLYGGPVGSSRDWQQEEINMMDAQILAARAINESNLPEKKKQILVNRGFVQEENFANSGIVEKI